MSKKFHFNSAVLKVASLCNLNCSYCYMYNLGDKTYKSLPKLMSHEIVTALAHKIKVHCLENNLNEFTFIFHGGEPLLADKDFYRNFLQIIEKEFSHDIIPFYVLQSNATLITNDWCEFFEENNISLSVSLDGNKEINDANRIYHNGKGSFDDVVNGIKIVNNFKELKKHFGVLAVINIHEDQRKLLQLFQDLEVKNIDLLFPNANYEKPPVNKLKFETTEYGDWLIKLFDVWYAEFSELNIRFFSNLIYTILGNNYSTDAYGEGLNELVVIETDGGIEAVDVLKICGDGFTKEGLNILKNDFDDAFKAPLINEYIHSHEILPDICRKCSLDKICSSGYMPHRFSNKTIFNNPSIYCHDLAKIITHIQNEVISAFPEKLLLNSSIQQYTYNDFVHDLKTNQV